MPLPVSTICVAAAFLFGWGFHGEMLVAGGFIVIALLNELGRIYSLRGYKTIQPTKVGDTTLIPNRERTPYEGRDEQ